MKGIKALSKDCAEYLQFKPSGPIVLSVSQLEELEESGRTKPFKRKGHGWVYMSSRGEIEVRPLKINEQ